MRAMKNEPKLAKERMTQAFALVSLLLMGGYVIAGPSGLMAWSETEELLDQRRERLVQLSDEREKLRNRVDLLHPRHADPDLAGELVRSNLNVAHPDEMVMLLR